MEWAMAGFGWQGQRARDRRNCGGMEGPDWQPNVPNMGLDLPALVHPVSRAQVSIPSRSTNTKKRFGTRPLFSHLQLHVALDKRLLHGCALFCKSLGRRQLPTRFRYFASTSPKRLSHARATAGADLTNTSADSHDTRQTTT